MQALRSMGVRVSLDDFGTGYSSLSYLSRFPIDQIKIDQSFVRCLGDANTGAVVRAIIGLAASLALQVVAEGVETMEQVRWLRDERCDQVQGFLLAEPLAPHELAEFVDRRFWFGTNQDGKSPARPGSAGARPELAGDLADPSWGGLEDPVSCAVPGEGECGSGFRQVGPAAEQTVANDGGALAEGAGSAATRR